MSDETPLLTPLHRDPIRFGMWYRHRDGFKCHEYRPLIGHVFQYAEGAVHPDSCIFCGVLHSKMTSPTWEECPKRGVAS